MRGVTKAHEKCVMKIKGRNKERKNDGCVNIFLTTGGTCMAVAEVRRDQCQ